MPRWPEDRETRRCVVSRCEGKHAGYGYCKKHLYRFQMNGDPLVVRHHVDTGTVEERFWKKVKPGPDGCQLWGGAKLPDPKLPAEERYGMWTWDEDGRTLRKLAHRYAYERVKGTIPEGVQLHHTCARRGCVNPEHLQLATALENTAESLQRKHLRSQRDALLERYSVLIAQAQAIGLQVETETLPSSDA